MMNKRVRQIKVAEKKTVETEENKVTYKMFHPTGKAAEILLSARDLHKLPTVIEEKPKKTKCVIM